MTLLACFVCCVIFSQSVTAVSTPKLDVYFAPYDTSTAAVDCKNTSMLQYDLCLIGKVKEAAQGKAPCDKIDKSCPRTIRFGVYNLLDEAYIEPLIAASKAGVGVQVLMDMRNLLQPYVKTCRDTKRDLPWHGAGQATHPDNYATIMHPWRILSWPAALARLRLVRAASGRPRFRFMRPRNPA